MVSAHEQIYPVNIKIREQKHHEKSKLLYLRKEWRWIKCDYPRGLPHTWHRAYGGGSDSLGASSEQHTEESVPVITLRCCSTVARTQMYEI